MKNGGPGRTRCFPGPPFVIRNSLVARLTHNAHVLGLWSLLPLGDFEFDDLALLEIPKPFAGNAGVVNEHVLTFLRGNEAIPLLTIKPLHGTFWHTRFIPPLGPVALTSNPLYHDVLANPA